MQAPFPKPIAAAIVKPDNTIEWVEPQLVEHDDTGWEPKNEWLKPIINGWLTVVRLDDLGLWIWLDEEGLPKNLPPNRVLTAALQISGRYEPIVGTGVVMVYTEGGKKLIEDLPSFLAPKKENAELKNVGAYGETPHSDTCHNEGDDDVEA